MRLGIERQDSRFLAVLLRKGKNSLRILACINTKTLAELRQKLPRAFFKTIIGIPKQKVFIKEIHLDPSLNSQEIKSFVEKNIEKISGKPLNELQIHFETMPLNAKSLTLRIVAIRKKELADWIDPLKKAHFPLLAIDINELAKNRLARWQPIAIEPEFLTALNIALWETPNVNLLPQRKNKKCTLFLFLLTLSLASSFFLYYQKMPTLNSKKSLLLSFEKKGRSINYRAYEKIIQNEEALQTEIKRAKASQNANIALEKKTELLLNSTPASIQLSQLTITPKNVEIRGLSQNKIALESYGENLAQLLKKQIFSAQFKEKNQQIEFHILIKKEKS